MSTTTTVPSRDLGQRMLALVEGNRIRIYRAKVKRSIRAGDVWASDLIANPCADLLSMKVIDVLVAMPRVGRVKANRVLSRARVSPSKTLGGLSERQRVELVRMLWAFPSMRRRAA